MKLKKILKTKFDQNIHENAPNCNILETISVEHAPEPPWRCTWLRDMHISKPGKFCPPSPGAEILASLMSSKKFPMRA